MVKDCSITPMDAHALWQKNETNSSLQSNRIGQQLYCAREEGNPRDRLVSHCQTDSTAHAVIYNLTHVVFEYSSKTREIPSSTQENLARYLQVLELCTSSAVLKVETRE